MSLTQLQALQALTDAHQRVFAAGRYQVIPSTLTAAVQGLKLPSTQNFDAATQDYIFNNYLCRAKRKQIAAYLDNPDPNNQPLLTAACLDIAQEWASIAVPAGLQLRNGKVSTGVESYYAGIGGNSAHGSVTNTMIALKAQWQYIKDQASGNANVVVGTTVTTSSGVLTDGSNNPVSTGSDNSTATMDVGISNASGGTVTNSCPAEWLAKSEAYTPSAGIGSGSPVITQQQAKAMHAELGYFESQWNYSQITTPTAATAQSIGPRIGKYQVDAPYLADGDRGYIKPDAVTQYTAGALANPASWTGRENINNQAAFLQYANTQDKIQFDEFNANYAALKSNGGIKDSDDICTAAGMLFVAHQMRSVDMAKQWRDRGGVVDVNGVLGDVYFNHGRYAIDILAAGNGTSNTGTTPNAALGGDNVSGVNPDDVFTFTSGSGSRASFDQLTGDFKTAVCKMAQAYKIKTGSRIQVTSCLRSQADQDRLYNAWVAGGGGPGRPTVNAPGIGNITTPVKLVGAHGQGIAMDSGQMAVVIQTVGADLVAQLGLKWGGTFRTADPVHVQSTNSTPQDIAPPSNPVIAGAGGVAVVGDGIAAGTGSAMQQIGVSVRMSTAMGASAASILRTYALAASGASAVIISVGTADITAANSANNPDQAVAALTATLQKIRSSLQAQKYIWILPSYSTASRAVSAFAASNGDQTVGFTAGSDNITPQNYATVAAAVKALL